MFHNTYTNILQYKKGLFSLLSIFPTTGFRATLAPVKWVTQRSSRTTHYRVSLFTDHNKEVKLTAKKLDD